jgi:error-prone DNA polymerase
MERLALIGALDGVAGISAGEVFTRGDVLARVRQLNAVKKRPTPREDQPMLDFASLDYAGVEQLPTGNAQMSVTEQVAHELEILHLDVTQHVLDQYRPMLDEMGVVTSNELVGMRNKSDVLVAGVRVATQTPPMRSGKRVVFITLDDGLGCADATFFDEAQARCSHILFNTKLVIIGGKTRRTGVNGVSIMAENAWDLKELWNQWVLTRATVAQTKQFIRIKIYK